MNFDSTYSTARRIALGIVLLTAAGLGVTIHRLQHQQPVSTATARKLVAYGGFDPPLLA